MLVFIFRKLKPYFQVFLILYIKPRKVLRITYYVEPQKGSPEGKKQAEEPLRVLGSSFLQCLCDTNTHSVF